MRASKNVLLVIAVALALLAAWALASRDFEAPAGPDAPAAATTPSAPAPVSAPDALPDDAPVLLVVGDSLSAGYGLERVTEGWVALLQARLRSEGYAIRVVNASISGDTTRGGRARLPAALDRFAPAITVIELGGNDGLRGFPLEEMEGNLNEMIAASRGAGSDVVLFAMMIPTNYGARYTEDFQQRFDVVASSNDVPLVPFFLEEVALDATLMQADGIHPNANAQPIMLDAVWPVIEPVLQRFKQTSDVQE
ncbi:MAG: arylesterase [Pseudomonadota bacterium]